MSRLDPVRQALTLSSDDAGLTETLQVMQNQAFSRRKLLFGLSSGALAAPLLLTPAASFACSLIPSETAGPYPGDGSNGPNVLGQSGIVRSDIRSSVGTSIAATATGTLMTLTLRLVSTTSGACTPLAGLAVYLWHCDRNGLYSLYSSGVTTINYLRGVQVSDANGIVRFTTIVPGAYSGRWPHMHFEVFSSLAAATSGANALRTSQLALPDAMCREVYAQSALYPGSLTNHNRTTLGSDNVFSGDLAVNQMVTVGGNISSGYDASLEVGIAAQPAAGALDGNQHGLTGNWYNAGSSGQGFSLEVFPDLIASGTALVQAGWFTFDVAPSGGVEKQRWYNLAGNLKAGTSSATLKIYQNTGGNFAAAPITSAQVVGSAAINFSSCTQGQLNYSFNDGRTGVIALSRLTRSVTCSTTTTRPTNADFALSGNYYSPTTSGQGFVIEINPLSPVAYFCWYTYAANGQNLGVAGQRWYSAQSNFVAGQRQITLTLYETTGGAFNTASSVATPTSIPVGTAVLGFVSCSSAVLNYSFTAGSNAGRSGSIDLVRLGPAPLGCTI